MTDYTNGGFGGLIDWGSDEVEGESAGDLPVYGASGVPTLLSSATEGDLYFINGSGINARLAIGSEGEFLTVSSGLPVWGAISTPVKLGETTLGSAANSMTVSGLTTTSYKQLLVIYHIEGTGNDQTQAYFNGASTGTGYNYVYTENGGSGVTGSGTAPFVLIGSNHDTDSSGHFLVTNEALKVKQFHGVGGTSVLVDTISGYWDNTSDTISSVSIRKGGGVNLDTGSRIEVYGIP